IAQTLEIINQRSVLAGGLSHSPYVPELGAVNPFTSYPVAQYPVAQGIGQWGINPWTTPFTQGLSHTPFVGYPVQRGLETGLGYQPAFGQFVPGTPFGNVWSQGLMHTPFGAGVGMGQGVPFASPLSAIGQGVPFASPLSAIGQGVPFISPLSGIAMGSPRFATGFGVPYPGYVF